MHAIQCYIHGVVRYGSSDQEGAGVFAVRFLIIDHQRCRIRFHLGDVGELRGCKSEMIQQRRSDVYKPFQKYCVDAYLVFVVTVLQIRLVIEHCGGVPRRKRVG